MTTRLVLLLNDREPGIQAVQDRLRKAGFECVAVPVASTSVLVVNGKMRAYGVGEIARASD